MPHESVRPFTYAGRVSLCVTRGIRLHRAHWARQRESFPRSQLLKKQPLGRAKVTSGPLYLVTLTIPLPLRITSIRITACADNLCQNSSSRARLLCISSFRFSDSMPRLMRQPPHVVGVLFSVAHPKISAKRLLFHAGHVAGFERHYLEGSRAGKPIRRIVAGRAVLF